MNQSYRIRLKPKTKLRIGLMLTGFLFGLAAVSWQFVTSDFFKQQDVFTRENHTVLEPTICRIDGKLGSRVRYCQFRLDNRELVQLETPEVLEFNGRYCVVETFKNGVFINYSVDEYEDCI